MQISIRHRTTYQYDTPTLGSVQLLHLDPLPRPRHGVVSWSVRTDERGRALPTYQDGLGNIVRLHTRHNPHGQITISVKGTLDVHADVALGDTGTAERMPPAYFLRPTACTRADWTLKAFAHDHAPTDARPLDRLVALKHAIAEAMPYTQGQTHTGTTAEDAFTLKRGVCQDHTHVFLACARHLGVPARYVSGYLLDPDDEGPHGASHAWAEAFVADMGWVGFDVSNRTFAQGEHVALAIGLDYPGAAPIVGLTRGGGDERLSVEVSVWAADQ